MMLPVLSSENHNMQKNLLSSEYIDSSIRTRTTAKSLVSYLRPSTIYMYLDDSRVVHVHGGDSIDTTCAVVRDVTAYIAVVRVFRFPSEYYGCRYTNSTHVKAARDCI